MENEKKKIMIIMIIKKKNSATIKRMEKRGKMKGK